MSPELFITHSVRSTVKTWNSGRCSGLKVLVTGGAGYVGGAVTDALLEKGHSVRVYDSLLYDDAYRKPVDFCFGDVRDEHRLIPNLQWADAVIWLAAIVGDGACALNPELTQSVNERALELLADSFNGRIVFTSTCSVYGAQDGIIDETAAVKPLSAYAITKLNAEKILKDKNAIIFRLGTLFGLSDTYSRIRLDLVVNTLTVKAITANRIVVYGGDQHRPLLHVRDAAQAIANSLDNNYTGHFNLHSENVRIIDLAERMRDHFPGLEIVRTDLKFQDNRTYKVSSEKARTSLRFSPKLTIDDGVTELKSLVEQGRIKNLSDRRYTNANHLALLLPYQPYIIDNEMPARV
jgi:nucleoside-diphosphate-sugar epimerase